MVGLSRRHHSKIEDAPIPIGQCAVQYTIGAELITQINDLLGSSQHGSVLRLDAVHEYIGVPGGARRRMHAPHLFVKHLSDFRLRRQNNMHRHWGDFRFFLLLFTSCRRLGFEIELEAFRSHIRKANRLCLIHQKVRFRKASPHVDLCNCFARSIVNGKQGSFNRSLDGERTRGEGLMMGEDILLIDRFRFNRHLSKLRNGQHGDILTPPARHAFRTDFLLKHAAVGFKHAPGDAPHRLFRLNPRPTRLTPARAVKEINVHPHPLRFTQCMHFQFTPLGREQFYRSAFAIIGLRSHIDITDHRTGNADLRHIFQVFGNALGSNIAANPIPIAPGPSRFHWLRKQLVHGLRADAQLRECDPYETQYGDICLFNHFSI